MFITVLIKPSQLRSPWLRTLLKLCVSIGIIILAQPLLDSPRENDIFGDCFLNLNISLMLLVYAVFYSGSVHTCTQYKQSLIYP